MILREITLKQRQRGKAQLRKESYRKERGKY
jgi:hypothetical protein